MMKKRIVDKKNEVAAVIQRQSPRFSSFAFAAISKSVILLFCASSYYTHLVSLKLNNICVPLSQTKPIRHMYTLYLKTTIIDWKTHHLLSKRERERDCTNIKKPWKHEETILTDLLIVCMFNTMYCIWM